jgi:hypothetical protein
MRLDLDAPDSAAVTGGGPAAPLPPLAPHPEWVYAWVAPMVF